MILYTGSIYLLALAPNRHELEIMLKTISNYLTHLLVPVDTINCTHTYDSRVYHNCNTLDPLFHLHVLTSEFRNINSKNIVHWAPFQPYGEVISLVFFLYIIPWELRYVHLNHGLWLLLLEDYSTHSTTLVWRVRYLHKKGGDWCFELDLGRQGTKDIRQKIWH